MEIARVVSALTSGGQTPIGVVYSVMRNLAMAGYIEVCQSPGDIRRGYTLTSEGQKRLMAITGQWENMHKTINRLIKRASRRVSSEITSPSSQPRLAST
jgi:DNA-binding PadR family transcriptional regulator